VCANGAKLFAEFELQALGREWDLDHPKRAGIEKSERIVFSVRFQAPNSIGECCEDSHEILWNQMLLVENDTDDVGTGVLALEKLLATPLLDGEHFSSCKVLFKNKRVLIKIERAEDATLAKRRYVVRYGDQRLNLTERKRFQELIEREYGFKIVSTEKRRIKAR
jgi:hypothetical protein